MNFPWFSKRKYRYSDSYSKEYGAWYSMLDRCYNASCQAWSNYGGRGISVCDRWLGEEGFDHFFQDMGEAPTQNHSLDRRDNSLGYFPANCRWATDKEQARNRRTNKRFTIGEETKTLIEWCEQYSINYRLVKERIQDGWDIVTALTTPKKRTYLNIGDEFNSWVIIGLSTDNKYDCQCKCGSLSVVRASDLINNRSKGCKSCRSRKNESSSTPRPKVG